MIGYMAAGQDAVEWDVVVAGELGVTGQAAIYDGPGGARRLRTHLRRLVPPAGPGRDDDRPVDTATITAALALCARFLVGDGESTGITLARELTATGGLRVGALGTVSGPATPDDPARGLRLLEKTGADTHLVEVTEQLGSLALSIPDAFGPSTLRHTSTPHPLDVFLRARWAQILDYLAHTRVVLLDLPGCEAVADQYAQLAAAVRRRNPSVRIVLHTFAYPGPIAELVPLLQHADLVVMHDGDADDLVRDDPDAITDILTRRPGQAIVHITGRTVEVLHPAEPPTAEPPPQAAPRGNPPATPQPRPGLVTDSIGWQQADDPTEDGPGRQRLAIVAAAARHATTDGSDLGHVIRSLLRQPQRPRPARTRPAVEPTAAQLALVTDTAMPPGSYRDGFTQFVDALTTAGHLPDAQWRTAFATVPRHLFLPRFFIRRPDRQWHTIDHHHPDYWQLVYSDRGLATQLHTTTPDPARPDIAGEPLSAANRPALIADLLHTLTDTTDPIARVLHIGTGSGYTAALLAHRFGASNVTTIEIDPVIARHARTCLAHAGHQPHVVVGDGIQGHPEQAPYDAIIATCAVPAIPAAWIEQLRDGGTIITGLRPGLNAGLLLRLQVRGGRASGRFLPLIAGLTPTRQGVNTATAAPDLGSGTSRKTHLRSRILDHPDASIWHALRVPGIVRATTTAGNRCWLYADDGSWAAVNDTRRQVTQRGPRRIWDQIETAHHHWHNAGQPTRDRIGVSITAHGAHRYWLDTPNTPLWTQPRPAPRPHHQHE
jgi:protein-L-isoaspartate O-methyltransferase